MWGGLMEKLGEHAIVLGASMGGLLTARVLADFYESVTVVERDVLPDDPENRRGVPQGRHVHALLARGAEILNELFPGFLDDLVADGALLWDGDMSRVWFVFRGHRLVPRGHADGLALYLASRPFLECHVRQRLRAIAGVTVLDDYTLAGFTSSPDCRRVTGARITGRGGSEQELAADLVVDAMGRAAHTPALLAGLGYKRPVEDHITVDTTYASQLLRIAPDTLKETGANISPIPGRPTGMFLSACERDTWIFTVFGMAGCDPPGDLAAMVEFARGYTPAHLLNAVESGQPLGEVARHRMPSSQWRRYDRLRNFPDGLLVTGDAICSFNPIYGQGMTVSALDAMALRECLLDGNQELAHRYFKAAAKNISVPWAMNATADLAFPEVDGRRTRAMRVAGVVSDWFLSTCESDLAATIRFFKVLAMTDSPIHLLHPAFLGRVAVNRLRRQRRGVDPAMSPADSAGRRSA
jgi:2-polyprenyl-6-methoxyphenol hydroxylase-like FAD-dependent oxidoreductase